MHWQVVYMSTHFANGKIYRTAKFALARPQGSLKSYPISFWVILFVVLFFVISGVEKVGQKSSLENQNDYG